LNIFSFKSGKEKVKVRVVEKRSVCVTIRKPFKLNGILLSIFVSLLFSGLFSYSVYVFANPPSSPYAPGSTLDPLCTPGSANCTVAPPLYISNNTLDISPSSFSSGNPVRIKYNSSNYATLTVGTNGDLTISTNSSGGGGNINFNSPTSSNATILSNSGILTLGGTLSGDENLNFDFHDYNDKVVVTSGTGVNALDFGSMNLSTTGVLTLGGSTTGTLVTRVSSGAPTQSDTNGSLVVDDTGGRLYFRYGNSWHYIAQTGGFQIPNFETVDPISGEPINEGDFVVGVINKSLDDGALHGVWVRWDTLKQQLLEELALNGGLVTTSTSTVSGEDTQLTNDSSNGSSFSQSVADTNLLSKVTNVLSIIGITIRDGVTNITNLAVDNFQAKTAKIEKLELVDSATGDPYCTWVENGQLKTEKGECGSVDVAVNNTNSNQDTKEALQDAADNAAQNAVDKIDTVIQKKVEEEVRNKLSGEGDIPSENSEGDEASEPSNSEKQPVSENDQNQNDDSLKRSDQITEKPDNLSNSNKQNNQESETEDSDNGNRNSESTPAEPSVIDTLIQDSTSALFDRMNLFIKSLIENSKSLSAGLMDPLKYLIESLSSLTKGGVSKASDNIAHPVASLYEGVGNSSFGEYIWIYNPKGILIEAKSNFLGLPNKSVALQRFMENNISNASANIFLNTMNIKESLFASIYK